MALSTNVQVGDPNHHALHNAERTAINASVKDDDARLTDARPPTEHGNEAHAVDYITEAEAAAAAPVQTVNGQTGTVAIPDVNVVPDLVAVAAVTITEDDVVVVGRGAPDSQTIELRHVTADGVTETLMQTVTVAAGSTAAQTPDSFSQAFVRGDRFRAVRTAGTGDAPVVTVAA